MAAAKSPRRAKPVRPERRARKPRVDGELARASILDAAERLFAERGFYGTSVREITAEAGVRLAAVNYHFRTKEELFRDVVLRRAEVLSQDRLALLERARARGGEKSARVEAVVRAFVAPLVERARQDRRFRDYYALIAQVSSSRLAALGLLADHFNPVAQRFVTALAELYPRASRSDCHHAYLSILGATLHAFSANRRLDALSQGTQRSDNFEAVGEALVRFAAAGVMRLLTDR